MSVEFSFTELVKIKCIAENRIQEINRFLETWAKPEADSDLNELYTQELVAYESIYTKLKEAVQKY